MGRLYDRCTHSRVRCQSSVTSWSSNIIYVEMLARAQRTLGSPCAKCMRLSIAKGSLVFSMMVISCLIAVLNFSFSSFLAFSCFSFKSFFKSSSNLMSGEVKTSAGNLTSLIMALILFAISFSDSVDSPSLGSSRRRSL